MTRRHGRKRTRRAHEPLPDPALLLDAINIVVLVVDRMGTIRSTNAAARNLLGYSSTALVDQSLPLILPSLSHRGGAGKFLRERSRSRGSIELKARSRTGRFVPVAVRCFGPVDGDQFVVSLRDLSERKRAKARGHAQRQYLRRIVEATGDAIVTVDDQEHVVLFSPKAEEIFGYAANEIIGEPFRRLLPSKQQLSDQILAPLKSLGPREKITDRLEIVCLRRGSHTFPAEASISYFRFRGRPLATLALRDLSESRAAERAARAQERLFTAVFDQALQHLAVLARDGTILEVNMSTERLLGRDAPSVKGLLFWQAPWWQTAGATSRRVKAAICKAAKGENTRDEFTALLPDGSVRTLDFSAHPIHCEDEGVSFIVTVARDITNRVNAEYALRESARRLANAQRIAGLGHWDWNIATGDFFWSDEIFRIFGQEHGQFAATYEAFLDCVHPDDRRKVDAAVKGAISSGLGYQDDYRVVRPDGSIRFVHEQGEILRDEAGHPIGMTGVVQDVTQAKQVEETLRAAKVKAEAANEAKSAFLANMSHELRTPLNAILGFSEIMMGEMFGPLKPERYRSYPKEIYDSGRHLLAIVNDMLDMAKIEHGKFIIHDQPIELADVVGYCARLMSGAAITSGLVLTSECQPDLPQICADPTLLRRVVLNLLSNAIKFTPGGGMVRVIGGTAQDGSLFVSVSDTGIGMAPEDVPTALEPFGQVESALCRRHGGTGLGLPLSKSLVELHGGQLRIESSLGKGTKITISLPKERIVSTIESAA